MKQIRTFLLLATLIFTANALGQDTKNATTPSASPGPQSQQPPAVRVVDLKASDGTILKASYFAAAKPGPAVLLYHQSNRTRKEWDMVARQLAAAGINTLTVDSRGHGESGGQESSGEARKQQWHLDLDAAFEYLISQPGVKRDVIGIGGAGVIGVENSVETARRHSDQVKSLVLLSGETSRDGSQFLGQASQLPELFVVADDDEYPPIAEAMELLYITASSPGRKFVHYSASHEAPWLWYEPFDIGKVPAKGGHGTDLFKPHPELPGIIVDWFVTTLIKTPGHAPADTVASAAILNQIETPEGDANTAIEIFKLNLLAYPDSADAHYNLADAYLKDGEKDLARQYAEKALALLDCHAAPLSSWSDTEERRGEIRRSAQETLKKLSEPQG